MFQATTRGPIENLHLIYTLLLSSKSATKIQHWHAWYAP